MLKLDAGEETPKKVRAFIEIPKGSHIKYEYDEKTGFIKVDRILHTSMVYPYNYGFVPGTLGEDGDPLDIMVISNESFAPGTTVIVKPVGVLLMKDEEGIDTKVMAVGDIENSYFIEAMRQLSLRHDVAFVNLTFIPSLEAVSEQKTKPAQIGLRLLLQAGIRPDFLICRTSTLLFNATKEKLALFSNLQAENIMDDPDLPTLYQLPLRLMEQGLDRLLIKKLSLKKREVQRKWRVRMAQAS